MAKLEKAMNTFGEETKQETTDIFDEKTAKEVADIKESQEL